MAIVFRQEEEWFVFYNEKGEKIERKTELRFDPLTAETSRLVFDAGLTPSPIEYAELAKETEGKNCPFCRENILKMTPLFPDEMAEDGRIFQGDAILFPNLFPYSKHNGVVVFSGKHYVKPDEFTPTMIKDALLAAQTYIQRVVAVDSKVKYASVNWNYLPSSGGSIIHPHMHIIISEYPTNYEAVTARETEKYRKENGSSFFTDLKTTEKELGERWIGEKGNISFVHAFAPKSHHDIIGIFTKGYSINDISEKDFECFAKGMTSLLSGMASEGFSSFNSSIHIALNAEALEPIHMRMIPRLSLGRLQTSDINFFQALHNEPLTYKVPEEISRHYRKHFEEKKNIES